VLCKCHCVAPQFLVIHVELRMHELDCTHQFNVECPCFLECLCIGDGSPRLRREAELARQLSKQRVDFIQRSILTTGGTMVHP
jgi:hypothetical protein